jgi:hypothetical protein
MIIVKWYNGEDLCSIISAVWQWYNAMVSNKTNVQFTWKLFFVCLRRGIGTL